MVGGARGHQGHVERISGLGTSRPPRLILIDRGWGWGWGGILSWLVLLDLRSVGTSG